MLVSAGADGAVHLWQPQDGTQIRTLAQFDDNPAVAAGWNLAGDRLAAAGGQTVKIWDGDGATVILDATDVTHGHHHPGRVEPGWPLLPHRGRGGRADPVGWGERTACPSA